MSQKNKPQLTADMKSILVVEDESVVAMDIKSQLVSLGYRVAGWVTTGEEALEAARQSRPDLVLMDIRLKGDMDGIEAADTIRSRLDIPIVYLTAHGDEETLSRAKVARPFGFVLKPFAKRDLRVSVALALYTHELESKVREERAFLNALFEAVPSSVLVVDGDFRVVMVNRHLEEALAIHRKQLELETRVGEVLGCPESHRQRKSCGSLDECLHCHLRRPIAEALDGHSIQRLRCEFTFVEGELQQQAVLLVSTAPLEHEGRRLAIVILEDVTELSSLRRLLGTETSFAGIVGRAPEMLEVFEAVRDVADVGAPVLIQGESGTGKELVARAIHTEGVRAAGNFVPVNCGALPDGLLESELFGHVRGAFTGAIRDRKGRFELAHGGTLFLDEIADLSLPMQVKLLRVLQEGSFQPVGSEKTVTVDSRVVCATNKDLWEEVQAGRFRDDLYYRLAVVPITVPPLRSRASDIPLIAAFFLEREATISGADPKALSPEVEARFLDYLWPGNVRELQNAIQYAWIKCKGPTMGFDHLPHKLQSENATGTADVRRRRKLTAASVADALRATDGNKSEAAKRLGVGRATLYRFLDARPVPGR